MKKTLFTIIAFVVTLPACAQYVPEPLKHNFHLDEFKRALEKIDSKNDAALNYITSIENARNNAISQNLSDAAVNSVWIETEQCLKDINMYVNGYDYSSALSIARSKAPAMISRIQQIVNRDKTTDYYKKGSVIDGIKIGDNSGWVRKVMNFRHGNPYEDFGRDGIWYDNLSYFGYTWDLICLSFNSNNALESINIFNCFKDKELALSYGANMAKNLSLKEYEPMEDEYKRYEGLNSLLVVIKNEGMFFVQLIFDE